MSPCVKCPTCKRPVGLGTEWFPFCSERCRLMDLGRWADEEYRIPVVNEAPGAEKEPPEDRDEGSGAGKPN